MTSSVCWVRDASRHSMAASIPNFLIMEWHWIDYEGWDELTIQDQPLNLAMESLLWQESLKLPLAVLGVEEGFGTNRAAG